MSGLYIMMTICSRKNMPEFVSYYKKNKIKTGNISLGRGTASSSVLDYLGLDVNEKAIAFSVIEEEHWMGIKKQLQKKLQIDAPGGGIAFIVPLSSIGGKKPLQFLLQKEDYQKEEE